MSDKAFKKGWIFVKGRIPTHCPQCLSDLLELTTKEEEIQDIKNRTGMYRDVYDEKRLKEYLQATIQGPDYWGYCIDCDYEFNPGM